MAMRKSSYNRVAQLSCLLRATRNGRLIVPGVSFRSLTLDGRNRITNLFIPQVIKDSESRISTSHNLLHDAGFLRKAAAGVYYLLPLGLRVQEKICRLADEAMRNLGAAKLELPTLSQADLWKKSGRWETTSDELFKVNDRRHGHFVLAPTNEEDITNLIATQLQSWRSYPLRVYQITRKFRDEKRPRGGLLRGREFLMKDMYSFDLDQNSAMEAYEEARKAYDWFFSQIGLPFITADAEGGNIGGSICHEYHYLSEAGEDTLFHCDSCGYAVNSELVHEDLSSKCPSCQEETLNTRTSIELGHTFYLGMKYSSVFNAKYMPANDPSSLMLCHMGCYGIGISRLIAAIVEVSHDNNGIIWPESVAPWKCVVMFPKQGGNGEETVYDGISSILGSDNVILDDRPTLNMGWKMRDAQQVGYPFIVGLGQKWRHQGLIEFVNRRTGETKFVESSALLDPTFWKDLSIQ